MRNQLNLPNALTLFRIFLVPVLVVVILTEFEWKEWIGVAVFLLAAATDWLDGWIARRRRQVTTLGKLLDPMADKLLIAGAFISLIEERGVPSWMVVVIIAREFAVTGLRGVAADRGVTIAALPWGKVKMGVQVCCVVALLLSSSSTGEQTAFHVWAGHVGRVLLWATVVVTVASGVEYFARFRRVLEHSEEGPTGNAGGGSP